MGKTDPFQHFAVGLMNWSHLVRTIDYSTFKAIMETVRGHPLAEEYTLKIWDLFENPVFLRDRLKNDFPKFMRIALKATRLYGEHEDLIP